MNECIAMYSDYATGRPSDPEVVTNTERSHAYGACAMNGGGQPRMRRSIGVCTKDDLFVLNGENSDQKNGSTSSVNSKDVRCLKLRLRSRFKNTDRRSSKETREVIDMGKLGQNNGKNKKSPLNGILKKMENKSAILADGASTISISKGDIFAKKNVEKQHHQYIGIRPSLHSIGFFVRECSMLS